MSASYAGFNRGAGNQLNAARLRQPSFFVWLSTGLFKDGNPVDLRLSTPWCMVVVLPGLWCARAARCPQTRPFQTKIFLVLPSRLPISGRRAHTKQHLPQQTPSHVPPRGET